MIAKKGTEFEIDDNHLYSTTTKLVKKNQSINALDSVS